MNHRERFEAAVSHRQTDRPPMDFVCEPWMRPKITEYLGVDSFEDALVRLDTDVRQVIFKNFLPQPVMDESGVYTDMWGARRKPIFNKFGSYDEVENTPFADVEDMKEVEDYPWPTADMLDTESLVKSCSAAYKDYAVIFGGTHVMDLINGTAYIRGYEQLLMDIALEDPIGLELMERRFRFFYEGMERALEAASQYIDAIWIGDDYGQQGGQLFSLDTWKTHFAPKLKAFIDLGHKYEVRVMLHSCGSNRALLPHWIELGLDIYQTVQVEAEGMEPEGLFRDFGKDITFHGSIGLQGVLPHGTPDEVRSEVIARNRQSGGSGWILAPSHNFQPDVPLENIVAMYEAGAAAGD